MNAVISALQGNFVAAAARAIATPTLAPVLRAELNARSVHESFII